MSVCMCICEHDNSKTQLNLVYDTLQKNWSKFGIRQHTEKLQICKEYFGPMRQRRGALSKHVLGFLL